MRIVEGFLAATLVSLAACSDTTGVVRGDAAALEWINQAAIPLTSVTPVSTTADLARFKTLVGSARVIGLGEATHGTREFFTMKDRLFRYLVEEGGVTAFAIEATMPEAFALDTYVRTGVGNPAVLLSHLYFWTWNTQEVANLIAALRAWNVAHPAKQVGFYGFDMQYPGMAIDSVTSFIARVAPSMSATIANDYSCLASYRNDTRGTSPQSYSAAGVAVWQACEPNVADAYAQLDAQRTALVAASSQQEFDLALRMARVVVQWEAAVSSGNSYGANRDASMAENVIWLLDREGPNGKLFLWAHNYHISRMGGAMGQALATHYGADYLPVGFAFASGGLNAVEGLPGGGFNGLKSMSAPEPVSGSYEETLNRATAANYILDFRSATGDAAAWLQGPRGMRSIGAVFFAQTPDVHYSNIPLSTFFDALIFIKATTPSVRLSFQY